MTCRGLYRLEGADKYIWHDNADSKGRLSTFHKWYYDRDAYLDGPYDDYGLIDIWSYLYGSGNHIHYRFAFADLEQMEEVWGPIDTWNPEMLNDLHDVLCLPGKVIDGDSQSIYHLEGRLN